jgi:hypothetical protein
MSARSPSVLAPGASPNAMSSVLRSRVRVVALVAGALWLPGCGGSADDEAREVRTTSVIADAKPVKASLLTPSDVQSAPRGSAKRAFLQYWSNLQFQAWMAAAQAYEPGLRRFIGQDVLIRALANQTAVYGSSRPQIVSASRSGDRTLIRYFRVGEKGKLPSSSSWTVDSAGTWHIAYDSLLDQALADLRQLEVQQATAPLAQKPVPAAIRAANRARKLQSEYAAKRAAQASAANP